jgi:DNA-directed RNA polymerase specialized sigma24 family protein
MSEHSVSGWLNDLKAGDASAAQKIWEHYFDKLVALARTRLAGKFRRVADEEDVALSAFRSFFRSVDQGRFPRLDDHDDLWKLLFTITERKVFAHIKYQRRQKRGGGEVRGHSVWMKSGGSEDQDSSGEWVCPEPTPDFAAEVVDEVEARLNALPEEKMREIAILKMNGFTNEEIAAELGCSTRTVKRKLQVIRTLWEDKED